MRVVHGGVRLVVGILLRVWLLWDSARRLPWGELEVFAARRLPRGFWVGSRLQTVEGAFCDGPFGDVAGESVAGIAAVENRSAAKWRSAWAWRIFVFSWTIFFYFFWLHAVFHKKR